MTDVPPNGRPDGGDASGAAAGPPAYPPPPVGPPPAFDDDALADALEADIASYTQPIAVIPPAAAPPPPPAPPPAVAPAAPAPYVEPQPEYQAPDVPEYVVPPAPPAPEYDVPPAPPTPAYEPRRPRPGTRTTCRSSRASRLRGRRRWMPSAASKRNCGVANRVRHPRPQPEPEDLPQTWEPALDHPAPGHVFPSPYQPFTDPVAVTPPAPPDSYPPGPLPGADSLPPAEVRSRPRNRSPRTLPPVDPLHAFRSRARQWQSAPPPSFAAAAPRRAAGVRRGSRRADRAPAEHASAHRGRRLRRTGSASARAA